MTAKEMIEKVFTWQLIMVVSLFAVYIIARLLGANIDTSILISIIFATIVGGQIIDGFGNTEFAFGIVFGAILITISAIAVGNIFNGNVFSLANYIIYAFDNGYAIIVGISFVCSIFLIAIATIITTCLVDEGATKKQRVAIALSCPIEFGIIVAVLQWGGLAKLF